MYRIKMQDTSPAMANMGIDTIQNPLNRIKHIEKPFPTQKEDFYAYGKLYSTSKNHMK